jgi:hypothetical protein
VSSRVGARPAILGQMRAGEGGGDGSEKNSVAASMVSWLCVVACWRCMCVVLVHIFEYVCSVAVHEPRVNNATDACVSVAEADGCAHRLDRDVGLGEYTVQYTYTFVRFYLGSL